MQLAAGTKFRNTQSTTCFLIETLQQELAGFESESPPTYNLPACFLGIRRLFDFEGSHFQYQEKLHIPEPPFCRTVTCFEMQRLLIL